MKLLHKDRISEDNISNFRLLMSKLKILLNYLMTLMWLEYSRLFSFGFYSDARTILINLDKSMVFGRMGHCFLKIAVNF